MEVGHPVFTNDSVQTTFEVVVWLSKPFKAGGGADGTTYPQFSQLHQTFFHEET